MRILIVEDEKRMAQALGELLKQEGYDTDICSDGEEGLLALESNIYDGAVIDVMLPKLSGFEVVRKARFNKSATPIMLLTARSSIDDKVTGLDSGADDYLTKPFDSNEFLARVRALTRRNSSVNSSVLSFGDIELNTKNFMLSCVTNALHIRLKDKEYKIMEYLLSNQGYVVEREQLALKIWGYENEAEYNNVEVYISFTRKKLAFIQSKTEIKSVRGIGYELRYQDV